MRLIWAAGLAALLAPTALRADGPGPDSPPGYLEQESFRGTQTRPRPAPVGPRPARRVTGGPDYAGSEWGLGKPMYYGLGSRPDWGRSSTD